MLNYFSKRSIVILLTVCHIFISSSGFAIPEEIEESLLSLPTAEMMPVAEELTSEIVVEPPENTVQSEEDITNISHFESAQTVPTLESKVIDFTEISPQSESENKIEIGEDEPSPETEPTPIEEVNSVPVTTEKPSTTPLPPVVSENSSNDPLAEESVNKTLLIESHLATKVVDLPLTIYRQESNSRLTGLYFLSDSLPLNAQVVAAQLVFTNSSSTQTMSVPFVLQAENNSAPVALSDSAPLNTRTLTTAYVNVNPTHNTRWAQGTTWTVDVTSAVQQIHFPLTKPAVVLMAKALVSAQSIFNGYTINDKTVSLKLVIVDTDNYQWWSAPSKALTTAQLSALNRAISQKKLQNNVSVQFSQRLIDENYCLVAEDKQLTRYSFAAQQLETLSTTAKLQSSNNLTYILDTGELLQLQPLIQNLIAFKAALKNMNANINLQVNSATYSINIDGQQFRLTPDILSTPVKAPATYQPTLDFIGSYEGYYSFALLFADEQGQWRQQLLFVIP